jgi:hypothetical protein
MATNLKAPNPNQVEQFQSEIQSFEAARLGQYSFLSEVVELIFGTMTLCWIVTSLCSLA